VLGIAEGAWSNDWAWGLPLIVLTVLVHAFGLVAIRDRVAIQAPAIFHARRSSTVLAVLIIVTVLLLTVLHAAEAFAWAWAYVALGARPDLPSAILYSLNAMTSYGHADIFLAQHWRLMGAIEALNGMMLFGLSTAFLFAVLREHWPTRPRG
jgi:Ion channel